MGGANPPLAVVEFTVWASSSAAMNEAVLLGRPTCLSARSRMSSRSVGAASTSMRRTVRSLTPVRSLTTRWVTPQRATVAR